MKTFAIVLKADSKVVTRIMGDQITTKTEDSHSPTCIRIVADGQTVFACPMSEVVSVVDESAVAGR